MAALDTSQTRLDGLIPKDVTTVSSLIESTGCDGTGVVVAVLDTGVDPGAAGLVCTTTGQRKVIDIVDCTGSGDVDTSIVVSPTLGESTITGLTGRALNLTDEIINLAKDRKFHIGVKSAYQLFPNSLVSRLRKERRRAWDKSHRRALNATRQKLSEHRDDTDAGDRTKNQSLVEEYEAQQTVLLSAEKNYTDCGPLYDCVVFHDGTRWRAVVDTSERGALAECDLLEDYHVNCRFGEFGNGVMMHFGVNIYEDGNVLSIVVDGGSHGTHVAGIVAANYPDAPHLNGMAPGAQIVSLKIGDSRLSSMETHQGTTRALSYLLRHSDSPESSDAIDGAEVKDLRPNPSETQICSRSVETANASLASQIPEGLSHSRNKHIHDDVGAASASGAFEAGSNKDCSHRRRIKVDIVNMSFGEHSRDVDKGRFVTLVNKLVHKHNVLFLSSAGNDGPALSSVSAPGGTTDALIGVGAYVTPEMLTQAYSLLTSEFGVETVLNGVPFDSESRKSPPHDRASASRSRRSSGDLSFTSECGSVTGIPYTWSSRGPVANGAMGVNICAPGGAIAPVPLWMLRKKMLMNGTSMSSPSAAGAVAVIVSFLKKIGFPYTSALVRRAIENTARPLRPPRMGEDIGEKGKGTSRYRKVDSKDKGGLDYYQDLVFAGGHGSIDASAACEYLQRCASTRSFATDEEEPKGSVENPTVLDATTPGTKSDGPNTARIPSDAQLVKRDRAAKEEKSVFLEEWRIAIRVEDGSPARRGSSSPGFGSMNTTHGIYLRGASETCTVQRASVAIEAVPRSEDCPRTKRAIANMEVNLILECAAPWVEVPASVVLLGGGRQFPVFVDPLELPSGRAHFTEILGFASQKCSGSDSSGPLFRVPVVVHKPEPLVDGLMVHPLQEVSFAPGSVVRRFYEAPIGATYGLLKIVTGSATFIGLGTDRTNVTDASSSVEFSEVSSRHVPASDDGDGASAKMKRGGANPSELNSFTPSIKTTETKHEDAQSDGRTLSDNVLGRSIAVSGSADARNFEAHIVQISPQKHCAELETRQYFTLRPGTVKECIVRVQGGSVLELCLAQMWSSPGRSLIDRVELVFGGVLPNPSAVHAPSGAACFPRVEVARFLPSVSSADHCPTLISGYSPRGCLTHLQRVLAPSRARIRALGRRDTLPEIGPVSQLQLDYKFEVFESSSTVKLLFPGLNRAVYESEIDGGPYVLVHDKNKQFMFASDIYPSSRSLTKGEYSVTAYLRHDRVDLLERLREQKLTVEYEMSSEVTLDVFDSAHAASMGLDRRRASKSVTSLECGERRAFYFGLPKRSSLPKWAGLGDTAIGKMSVDKLLTGSGNSVRKGSDLPSYQLSLAVGPNCGSIAKGDVSKSAPKAGENGDGNDAEKGNDRGDSEDRKEECDTSDNNKDGDAEKCEASVGIEANPDQWFEEAVRKLKVKRLRSFLKKGKLSEFESLYSSVEEKYPEDIEILMLNVEKLDVECCREYRKNGVGEEYKKIVKKLTGKADNVIKRMNVTAIATHFGMMIDPDSKEEASQRKKFETKKGQLVEVLFRKARALSNVATKMNMKEGEEKKVEKEDGKEDKVAFEEFEKAVKHLCRWVTIDGKGSLPGGCGSGQRMYDGSVTNEDLVMLGMKREEGRGRYGMALKVMDGFYGNLPSKKVENEEMAVFKEELLRLLQWGHLEERDKCARVLRFPSHRMLY